MDDYAKILQDEIERLRQKEAKQAETLKALQEEFADANDPEAIVIKARKAIKDLMPVAITQMGILIEHAESESVRASLSKFVVAAGLDKSKFEDDSSSTLQELLKQLANNDA